MLTTLEAAAGFLTVTTALWFVVNAPRQGVSAVAVAPFVLPPSLLAPLSSYFLRDGLAANYVIPSSSPSPYWMAHLAGSAGVFVSWMVILPS